MKTTAQCGFLIDLSRKFSTLHNFFFTKNPCNFLTGHCCFGVAMVTAHKTLASSCAGSADRPQRHENHGNLLAGRRTRKATNGER